MPAIGAPRQCRRCSVFCPFALPDDMLLAVLAALGESALRRNGKVNRAALGKAWLQIRQALRTAQRATSSFSLRRSGPSCRAHWTARQVRRVGDRSLLAAQIIARVQDAFGARSLFACSSRIAAIANTLEDFPQVARAAARARLRAHIDRMDPAQFKKLLNRNAPRQRSPKPWRTLAKHTAKTGTVTK
jgi:hypothetical protein